MSPLRSVFLLIVTVAMAAVASGCTSGPGAQPPRGPSAFQSIFNTDLSARQPRAPATHAAASPAVLGPGSTAATGAQSQLGGIYLGKGPSGNAAYQTVSSFAPGEISLNFQNADLREVVQAILGDALEANYTIDQTVSGSVTISSARPVSKDDLIPILETVLQMNGSALVREGEGSYRVVPETSAVSGWGDVGDASPGYGISILPLRYTSAQTLISLIDGFGTRPGSVRAEASRNLLIVLGNSADREAAIETALSFDADWMQDQSVAVLPLRHAKPEAVIPELERVFGTREGGAAAGIVQFMPMARLKAVLVVSPQRDLIERARTWVGRLDAENPDINARVHVYRVKHRDAKKLADLLNRLFSSSGGGLAEESPGEQIEPGAQPVVVGGFSDNQDGQEGGLIAGPEEGQGQDPSESGFGSDPLTAAPEESESASSGSTKIQADTSNNSLVIYADLETRQEILDALVHIDVPQLQVAINVTMAEVRLTEELRYGIQYFLKSKDLGLGSDNGSASWFNAGTIGREVPGFNFLLGSERSPNLIISAFDSITDVQVLSSPSLVVVENETAKFQVGDQIPIVTRTVTSVEDPLAPVSNEVEYRDTGIILNVKPRVAENGQVTMTIEQEISSVSNTTATLTPTISNRRVSSSISVIDGQTVLLGGLISEQSGSGRQGLPGLNRMKFVRNVFGKTTGSSNRTELIILIRPTVIRDGQDAEHVATELRSRLWGLGASQAR